VTPIPDPLDQPTIDLWPTVGEALGLGRSAVYELAARNELPVCVLKLGRRRRVATAELRRVLGLRPSDDEARDQARANATTAIPATAKKQGRHGGP
jgi:predicted DNA-binding transcriptional regulator AlpA